MHNTKINKRKGYIYIHNVCSDNISVVLMSSIILSKSPNYANAIKPTFSSYMGQSHDSKVLNASQSYAFII